MYNRYIPQNDGSYRRSRIPEPQREVTRPAAPPNIATPPAEPCHQESASVSCPNCIHTPPSRPAPPARKQTPTGIGSFLKQLLPRNFDTEDLLIVLLLLLIASDCREDQNSALLTLVLYLFL